MNYASGWQGHSGKSLKNGVLVAILGFAGWTFLNLGGLYRWRRARTDEGLMRSRRKVINLVGLERSWRC